VTPRRHPVRTVLPTLLLLISAVVVIVVVRWGQRELDFQHTQVEVRNAALRLASPDGDGAVLASLSRAQRDLAAFVQPSVVHIDGLQTNPHRGNRSDRRATGSGWIWDASGHVVTVWHVVRAATSIEVQLHDGTIRIARLVASDPLTDIAVLSMDPARTVPATRSQSPGSQQGDMVFAFGSPLDFRFSVTGGVVSGLGRTVGGPDRLGLPAYENFLQIDAPINPGSSGGPVTSHLGHVVGMSTAIAADATERDSGDRFTGVALAIPIEMIESIVPQLIEEGHIHRGLLGVTALDSDHTIASMLNAKMIDGGGLIASVTEESPLFNAGLRRGDVIWSCNERPLMEVASLQSLLQSGDRVMLEVSHIWRDDPLQPRVLEIATRPSGGSTVTILPMSGPIHALLAALGGPPTGVLVASVTPGGAAAEAGVRRGDLITHVTSKEIRTVDQLRSVVSAIAPGSPVEVSLWRASGEGGNVITVTATLNDQAESPPR